MFEWVLLEGLLQAVQAMEQAGLELMAAQAAAAAGGGSSSPAVIGAAGQHAVQQHNKQLEQPQGRTGAAKHSMAALKELAKAVAMLPMLSNLTALLALPVKAAWHAVSGCCGAAPSSTLHHKQALKHKRQHQRQLLKTKQHQQPVWLSFLPARVAAAAAAVPAAVVLWLAHRRAAAAAAFKFWLSLSLLMVLMLLLSDGAGGGVHPVVVTGVRAVPTHGVIAFVLAWHERVESTTIRVSVLQHGGRGISSRTCGCVAVLHHGIWRGCGADLWPVQHEPKIDWQRDVSVYWWPCVLLAQVQAELIEQYGGHLHCEQTLCCNVLLLRLAAVCCCRWCCAC
jgi:hypothetical protein